MTQKILPKKGTSVYFNRLGDANVRLQAVSKSRLYEWKVLIMAVANILTVRNIYFVLINLTNHFFDAIFTIGFY